MNNSSWQRDGLDWASASACVLGILLYGGCTLQAQITTRTDPVGQQLNAWAVAGEAAGLYSVRYENRDGGHSSFELPKYPQLRPWRTAGEETGSTPNVGLPNQVRMEPVFGNCSMAAPADQGGSLPRLYMLSQSGFEFLTGQYLRNNLFVFPEHQDYDPGYNGRGGWGDMYPANIPMVVISQGSSFTDIPFLQAFYSTMAAFPPDTQAKLIESRLLVPTLQSIFRQSNRTVQSEEDYFTGKAHPPVFDGVQINEEKMINTAHLMSLSRVPPVAMVEVASESPEEAGRDFFEMEPIKNSLLGTTPVSVGRIFRGSSYQREMVVKATRSADLLRRPLSFRWSLLQGDPKRVKIEPNREGGEAKITVSWHPEMKTTSGLSTHRVDIGLFVSNGFAWSAPAIISFYMLPNEARFYDDDGRLIEICYEAGNPDLGIPAISDFCWLSMARRLKDRTDRGSRLLASALGEEPVRRLQAMADELAKPQEAWRMLSANPENKAAADTAKQSVQERLQNLLNQPVSATGQPLWRTVEQAISRIADAHDLYTTQQQGIQSAAASSSKTTAANTLAAARHRLVGLMVLNQSPAGEVTLRNQVADLSEAEKYQLRHLNLIILNEVLLPDFLERTSNILHVDSRLTIPKSWRDIYRYSKSGSLLGWSRITEGRIFEFDASGRLFKGDRTGTPVEVKYMRDAAGDRLIFMPK